MDQYDFLVKCQRFKIDNIVVYNIIQIQVRINLALAVWGNFIWEASLWTYEATMLTNIRFEFTIVLSIRLCGNSINILRNSPINSNSSLCNNFSIDIFYSLVQRKIMALELQWIFSTNELSSDHTFYASSLRVNETEAKPFVIRCLTH
jgi:hypothetical protein